MKEIYGEVKAKRCECCGHHEIGIIDKNGDFISLKPGDKLILYSQDKWRTRTTDDLDGY